MMSPWEKLSKVLLLSAVWGKMVFTFCFFIMFSPVATETDLCKLGSSEVSVEVSMGMVIIQRMLSRQVRRVTPGNHLFLYHAHMILLWKHKFWPISRPFTLPTRRKQVCLKPGGLCRGQRSPAAQSPCKKRSPAQHACFTHTMAARPTFSLVNAHTSCSFSLEHRGSWGNSLDPLPFSCATRKRSELEMLVFWLLTRARTCELLSSLGWEYVKNLSAIQPLASLQRKALWLLILMDKGIEPKRVPRLVQLTTGKWQLCHWGQLSL